MRILNFKKLGKAFLCAIPLLCLPTAVLAEWSGNTEVEIRHDNNINNAQSGNDIAGDSVFGAGISATNFFPFEAGNSLSLSGELKGEAFNSYTGLSNLSLGAALAFRKKLALGPYAPWVGLSLSSAHLNYDNNIRNGWRHQIAIRGGKRIFERWDVRAEYMVERRTANALPQDIPGISSDIFSQSSRAMTLNAEYTWSDSLFLTFGSLLRHGDVVASTRRGRKIFSASKAIADDPVFGPDFYAYRMAGTSYGLNMGVNIAVTSHSMFHTSLARQLTYAEGDNNYAKTVAMLSWNYNF
ncbi:MAG: hypothetical protein Q8P42_10910 [Gallionella sp.]|nr:hypothetical protein [Gallionella sp.]